MKAGRLARHPLALFGIALYVFPYLVVALGKSSTWAVVSPAAANALARSGCDSAFKSRTRSTVRSVSSRPA